MRPAMSPAVCVCSVCFAYLADELECERRRALGQTKRVTCIRNVMLLVECVCECVRAYVPDAAALHAPRTAAFANILVGGVVGAHGR